MYAVYVLIAFLGFTAPGSARPYSDASPAQGSCQWPLDPFFGTYDMDMSQQVNMVKFSNEVVGVPLDVVKGGERQIFNLTDDGAAYQQFVLRSDPSTSVQAIFVCGETSTVPLPGGLSLTFGFEMISPSILQATYSFFLGTHTADFVVQFDFGTNDGCGFFDTVSVLSPQQFTATAPFICAQ